MADGAAPQTGLPERAIAVAHIASEYADESETLGKLAEPVVAALHENELFGMWVPKSVGGAELDPVDSLQVIENLAYGDPSTGWVLMAAALANGTGAAYLEKSAVDELFAEDQSPVIAGQGTRPGNAVVWNGIAGACALACYDRRLTFREQFIDGRFLEVRCACAIR